MPTARKALKELQDKGYLIEEDEKTFNFYEYPHSKNKKVSSDYWGI